MKKRKKKSLVMGSLIAIARPEAIYVCKVIEIDKTIQGQHFDYYFIDELQEIPPNHKEVRDEDN